MDRPGDRDAADRSIAIVGIGCRYPGVHGPNAFWQLIKEGRSTVTGVPEHRVGLGYDIDRYLDPRPRVPGRISTPHAGFLEHPDLFDPVPFGLAPREVRAMEPQQRLMLEVAWDALIDGGIRPESLEGERVAVMIGHMVEDYSRERIAVLGEETVNRSLDVFTVAGMSRAIMAGRISFLLGVTGPSFTLDTACSSSLITTHLACQSLLAGESKYALAGGANLFLTPEGHIALSRSGMLAPDGACKAFDASADGFVRAEGAGMVLLRPLRDALADGDPIYAVIRGTGISTDGRDGGHMMAPGRLGQAQAMRDAYARAGVSPADVDFVETHGTGTVIGDPVEIGALADVMGPGRDPEHPLMVSSVKGNIGHTESASGVAGLIKTALALHHRELPAQLHFRTPTPHIPWDEIPIRVQAEHAPWPGEGPRLAGVNSFGISGTNAHVVLESAPPGPAARPDDGRAVLVPLCAHDPAALNALARQTIDRLGADDAPSLRELAYTYGCRRDHPPHRLAAVARTRTELVEELEGHLDGRASGAVATGHAAGPDGKLVLVFPGQGAQHPGMAVGLLDAEPAFRACIEELDAAYARCVDWSLVDALREPERTGGLQRLSILQPTLIAVEIAIARLLGHWGVEPDAVVGQSLGEVAAAHVAGCLDVDEVAKLACHRGVMVERAAGRGAMAIVGLPESEVQAVLAPYDARVEIAGVSAPGSTLVAGDREPVGSLVEALDAREIFARRLEVDFASHCFHMDPLLDDFAAGIAGVGGRAGRIPLYSTVDGRVSDGADLDTAYWVSNLRSPVAFTRAVDALLDGGAHRFVEVSPHPTLARAIPETAAAHGASAQYVATLSRQRDEPTAMLSAVGALFASGGAVDFAHLHPATSVVRTEPYPYQRRRFWFGERTRADMRRSSHELLGPRIDVADDRDLALYERSVDLDMLPFLADFRIDGRTALPPAVHVELALAVARDVWPGAPIEIRDLVLAPPALLDADDRLSIQVSLRREGERAGRLRVATRRGDEPWTVRATARLEPARPALAPVGAEDERRPTRRPMAADDHYGRLALDGVALGPRMRTVRELERDDDALYGRLEIARVAESESHAFVAHPSLLEAALGLSAAASGHARWTAIDRIRISEQIPPAVRCTARPGAFAIESEDGRPLAAVEGIRCHSTRATDAAALSGGARVHPLRWRALACPAPGERGPGAGWILCGDDDAALTSLAAELTKRGLRCVRRSLEGAAGDDAASVPPGRFGLALLGDRHDDAAFDALAEDLGDRGVALSAVWTIAHGARDLSANAEESEGAGADETTAAPRGADAIARVRFDLDPDAGTIAFERLADWMAADVGETVLVERAGRVLAPRLAAEPPRVSEDAQAAGFAPAGARCFEARIVTPGEMHGAELRACTPAEPGVGEVRLAVDAALLSRADAERTLGLRPCDDARLGFALAGTVEAVGPDVTSVRVGDAVAGFARGAIARACCAPASDLVVRPADVTPAEAASALSLAAARHLVEDVARVRAGDRVWIQGEGADVGAAAIAVALAAGARVLATATSERHASALRTAGVTPIGPAAAGEDVTEEVLRATAGNGADLLVNTAARVPISGDLRALARTGELIDARPREAHDGGPVESLRLSGARSHRAFDLEGWLDEDPAAVREHMRSALAAHARGELPLPAPTTFPIAALDRAIRWVAQDRAVGPVAIAMDDAADVEIRPASGRPSLLSEAGEYGVVCGSPAVAASLAGSLRDHGAGRVHVVAEGPALPAAVRGIVVVEPALAAALGGDAAPAAETPTPPREDLDFLIVVSTASEWLDPTEAAPWRGATPAARHVYVDPAAGADGLVRALERALASPGDRAPLFALGAASEREAGLPLYAELVGAGQEAAGAAKLREAVLALAPADRPARLVEHLRDGVAVVLAMGEADRARITPERALDELGLDSLMTLELRIGLQRDLAMEIDAGCLSPGRPLADIASAIVDRLAAGPQEDPR